MLTNFASTKANGANRPCVPDDSAAALKKPLAVSGQTHVCLHKFSYAIRNYPFFDELIRQIDRLPFLYNLINQFPGKIREGDPGEGIYFSLRYKEVVIDRGLFRGLYDPAYLSRFIAAIAHEMGHAVLSGGKDDASFALSLDHYVEISLRREGTALLAEYLTARKLGKRLWHDHLDGHLYAQLDGLLAEHSGDDINNPKLRKMAIKLGGELYALDRPPVTPHLTYRQRFRIEGAAKIGNRYCSDMMQNIDWPNVKWEEIKIDCSGGGWPRLAEDLPMRPLPSTDKRQAIPKFETITKALTEVCEAELVLADTPAADSSSAIDLACRADQSSPVDVTRLQGLLDQLVAEGVSILELPGGNPNAQKAVNGSAPKTNFAAQQEAVPLFSIEVTHLQAMLDQLVAEGVSVANTHH